MLKVGYIGQLWSGGTCLERARVLRHQGWGLALFDTTPYLMAGNRVSRALQHRLLYGPHVEQFNRELVEFIERVGPLDVIWIDKGRWLYSRTLMRIKDLSGALLVHYTPDPAFTLHASRHFQKSLTTYDLCITTKRYELQRYREGGAKKVLFTWQGIDDRFVKSVSCDVLDGAKRTGIVFIGHTEKHYRRVLTEVARGHSDLKIWGPGWERCASKYKSMRPFVKGGPLWGEDYVSGLASACIGLGLLSKYYPDQFTTRSFEIPAAGTMLIAERTEEHLELFDEGKEAEFFSSLDELNEKIDFYLKNEIQRVKIAERGRQRTLSCYHWRNVLLPAIKITEEMRSWR
jgi:spore maturation protein CgeB